MFKPYRADVIQGNFVSREMAEELKPGMTKDQVQAIMGTPLLKTVFNQNRWEYVFSLRQGYHAPIVRRYTVYFDKDGAWSAPMAIRCLPSRSSSRRSTPCAMAAANPSR
jgi:Small protein A (tmRNA-binding)